MKRGICVLLTVVMLLTLCPIAFAAEDSVDITNFEPFKIPVERAVVSGTNLRLVLPLTATFPEGLNTDKDALVNARARGTATNKTDKTKIVDVDKLITANEWNADQKMVLTIALPTGIDSSTASSYTYDLTLYPKEEITVNNFPFFRLTVTGLGNGAGAGQVRMLIKNEFSFDVSGANTLYGCIVSGKMTREIASGTYLQEVIFDAVPIMASEARANNIVAIDLQSTDAVNRQTIEANTTGFKLYTFELTIHPPAAKEELVLPEDGNTFFVKPSDFALDKGTWVLDENETILRGLGNAGGIDAESASVLIHVPQNATYYVWGYANDVAASSGQRIFKLGINGSNLPNELGKHGADGYQWELAGACELKAGVNTVKVVDIKKNYARLKGIMFTSSESSDFKVGAGVLNEVFEKYPAELAECLQMETFPVMGDKTEYKIVNRTNTAVENVKLHAAIYSEDDTLVEVKTEDFTLAAKENTGIQTIEFSGLGDWESGKLMLFDNNLAPLVPAGEFSFNSTDLSVPDDGADDFYGTNTDMMLEYKNEKEFNARNGLPNVLRKLESGENVTVGYVGTSITHGDTWRPLTTKWLKDTYGEEKIKEVSIAASGTNSNLGASLVGSMLLEPHQPDLVFVEYIIAGGKGEWMEGIVRQIWQFDPTIDIFMVHPVHTKDYEDYYKGGGVNPLAAEYEKVAVHYDIPSINLNYQIFDLYEQGKLTLKASAPETGKILFSKDGTHPTKDGGYLFAGAVARSMLKMSKSAETVNHTIPQIPLHANHWSDARSYDISDLEKDGRVKFEGNWIDCVADSAAAGYGAGYDYTGGYLPLIKTMMPTMKGTKSPGSSVTIKFKGKSVGIFEAGGQYSGNYSVKIDDKDPYIEKSFNQYCTKLRHQYFFIPEQTEGEHTVTITLLDEVPQIKAELKEKYPNDPVYNKTEAYFGKILVRGEILSIIENPS